MSFVSLFIVFALSWWFALFLLLPMGVKPSDTPQVGNARSAPEKLHARNKLIGATVLAVLITVLYAWLTSQGLLSLDMGGVQG
jgi:predicted secreted protein